MIQKKDTIDKLHERNKHIWISRFIFNSQVPENHKVLEKIF